MTDLLAGFLLLTSFALLAGPATISLATGRLQATALAAAALCQAYQHSAPGLYATAVIILGVQAILFQLILRRAAWPRHSKTLPAAIGFSLGIAVFGAASLATETAPPQLREVFAIALAMLLLGLLTVATHRDPTHQWLGGITTANGVTLAAISLPALLPYAAPLAACLTVFMALPFLAPPAATAAAAAAAAAAE